MDVLDEVTPAQRDLMLKHLDLVIQMNQQVNLTRIDSEEDGVLLHTKDSLSALPELLAAPKGLYGDLGSGGGFPGIPLAVASGRRAILVDARQKKMVAMQHIIEQLELDGQIGTFAGRAELLAQKQPGSFAVLTARALAKVPVLLELASPLLQSGGHLICYKAQMDESEVNDGKRVAGLVGMELVSDRSFDLEGYSRRILAYRKTRRSSVKLPRREGEAQKNPL